MKGNPLRRGKSTLEGHRTSREVALLGIMSMTGLPAMTVPGVQVLDIPISVVPPFWKPRLLYMLGVMYHISLCTSVPTSIPLSIDPSLLQCLRALHHSITPITPVMLHHTPSLHFIFHHPLPFSIFTVISVMFYHLDMILNPIS